MNFMPQHELEVLFKDFTGKEAFGAFNSGNPNKLVVLHCKTTEDGQREGFWDLIDLEEFDRDSKLLDIVNSMETSADKQKAFNLVQEQLIKIATSFGYTCSTMEADFNIAIEANKIDKVLVFRMFNYDILNRDDQAIKWPTSRK